MSLEAVIPPTGLIDVYSAQVLPTRVTTASQCIYQSRAQLRRNDRRRSPSNRLFEYRTIT